MTEHILFVFEGEKTENQIANNLLSFFIKEEDKVVVKSAYKTDIYWLYNQIIEDDDLDIFHLLKEKNDHLKDYPRDIFSPKDMLTESCVITDCPVYVKTGKDTVQIRYGQYALASYADGEQVFEYNTKTGKLYYLDQTSEEVKKIEIK